MRETIEDAIIDASNDNPAGMTDKIGAVLMDKVSDILQTKKMEISNKWLNDIEPSADDEDGDE